MYAGLGTQQISIDEWQLNKSLANIGGLSMMIYLELEPAEKKSTGSKLAK